MTSPAPVRVARRFLRQLSAPGRVRRALARVDGDASPLLRAIDAAVRRTATDKERAWIAQIEALRRRLLRDSTPLTIVDYGAREPGVQLSQDAMYSGRPVTRTVAELCRGGSKSPFWAGLLFRLVREIAPRSCVELGANLGLSAAYQAAALSLNGRGRLVTIEGAAPVAELAERHLAGLGLDSVASVVAGRFQDTLEGVLDQCAPVDYVFVDGHHDVDATLRYFELLHGYLAPTAVVVFDDIEWSEGMRSAWQTIQSDERVRVSIDLGAIGICSTGPATVRKQRIQLPLR